MYRCTIASSVLALSLFLSYVLSSHQFFLKLRHPTNLTGKSYFINGTKDVPSQPVKTLCLTDRRTSSQVTLSYEDDRLKIVTDDQCTVTIIQDNDVNRIIYPKKLAANPKEPITPVKTDESIIVPLNGTFIIGMPKMDRARKKTVNFRLEEPFGEEGERLDRLIMSLEDEYSSEFIFGSFVEHNASAMLHACKERNLKKVTELLNRDEVLDLDESDENGMTPLLYLISAGLEHSSEEVHNAIKEFLIKSKTSKSDINKGDPLAKAVEGKSIKIVETLLDSGAIDVNSGDPLKIAITGNSFSLAKLISAQPTVIVTVACMKEYYSNISQESLEFKQLFQYSERLLTLQSRFDKEEFASVSTEIITKAAEGSLLIENMVSFLSLFGKLEFQCLAVLLCKYLKKMPDRILEHDYLKPFLAVKFPEHFKQYEDYRKIINELDLISDSLKFFESAKRFSLAFGDDFSLGQKFPVSEGTVLKADERSRIENIDGIEWLKIEGSQTYLGARAFVEILKLVLKFGNMLNEFAQIDPRVFERINSTLTELLWVAAVDYLLGNPNFYSIIDKLTSVAIETLPLGKKVLLPYGYANHDGIGHTMLCEFEGLRDDKFRIYIYNTGDGISNHISAAIGGRIKYLPYHIFDEVPRNILTRSSFVELFSLLSTPSRRQSKFEIDGTFIYQDLLLPFEEFLVKDLSKVREITGKNKLDFATDQKSGSCSYMVFRMRARFQFGEDFRKVMVFINTFVQMNIIQNNLRHADFSIFWKRALLARTESAARALYKWIRKGEDRFNFNGNNIEVLKKILLEKNQSRQLNKVENEIFVNIRTTLFALNSSQPPLLPIPNYQFLKSSSNLSVRSKMFGSSQTFSGKYDIPSPGDKMKSCTSMKCYITSFSEVINAVFKIYEDKAYLEYCLLTIRRTFLLLPDVDSQIWSEDGTFTFLEDIYLAIFMMSDIVKEFQIIPDRADFIDFFVRFKAAYIALKIFRTCYPKEQKFKFDCRPIAFVKNWYLFRSFDADTVQKFAKLYASCTSEFEYVIFSKNNLDPDTSSFEYKLIKSLSSGTDKAIEAWINSEGYHQDRSPQIIMFFSEKLDRKLCEEDRKFEPLRALKILLVLSSYCMNYDIFRENFIDLTSSYISSQKLIKSISRSEGFNTEAKSWKFNYGFDVWSSYRDSFLENFKLCKELKEKNCSDQGLISSIHVERKTFSTIIELWTCEYMMLDEIFAYLSEFQCQFTLEEVKLISHLSSLPRTTNSSQESILNMIKYLEFFIQKYVTSTSSDDENLKLALENLKTYVFLLDLMKLRSFSKSICESKFENFKGFAESLLEKSKGLDVEQILTALRIKVQLLSPPYDFISIFQNISNFESLRSHNQLESRVVDYEAEVIFQEARVKFGNLIESLSMHEQQGLVDTLGYRGKKLTQIAYPIALFCDYPNVNIESPPNDNPSLRPSKYESVSNLKDFGICLSNIPQQVSVKMNSNNSMTIEYSFGKVTSQLVSDKFGEIKKTYEFETEKTVCSELAEYTELGKYAPFSPLWNLKILNFQHKDKYCRRFLIFHCTFNSDSIVKIIDVESEDLAAEYDLNNRTALIPSNKLNAKYLDIRQALIKYKDLVKFREYHESWGASIDIGNEKVSFPISFLEREDQLFIQFHTILRPLKYLTEKQSSPLRLNPYIGSMNDRYGWTIDGYEELRVPFNQKLSVKLFQDYLIIENSNLIQAIVPDVEYLEESDETFKVKRFKTIMIDAALSNNVYEIKPISRYQRLLIAYHYARSHEYIEAIQMLASLNNLTVFNDKEYRILTLIAFLAKFRGIMIPELCTIEYLASVLILYNQSIFPKTSLLETYSNDSNILPKVPFQKMIPKHFVQFWFGKIVIEYSDKNSDSCQTLLNTLLKNYLKNASSVKFQLNLSVPFACDSFWTLKQEKYLLESYLSINDVAIVRISQIDQLLQLDQDFLSFMNYKTYDVFDSTFSFNRRNTQLYLFGDSSWMTSKYLGKPSEIDILEPADAFKETEKICSILLTLSNSPKDDRVKTMVRDFFFLIRQRVLKDQGFDKNNTLNLMEKILGATEYFFDLDKCWESRLIKATKLQSLDNDSKTFLRKLPRLKHNLIEATLFDSKGRTLLDEELLKMGFGDIHTSNELVEDALLPCLANESYTCYALSILTEDSKEIEAMHAKIVQKLQRKIFEKHPHNEVRFANNPTYGVDENCWHSPSFLVFEYRNGITIRSKNVAAICRFLEKRKDGNGYKDFLLQLLMGSGKTFVIGPQVAFNLADGSSLPVLMSSSALFATNASDIIDSNRTNFKQKGHVFVFGRDNHYIDIKNLDFWLRIIKDAINWRQFLVIAPETIQILENKYVELLLQNEPSKSIERIKEIMKIFREHGIVVIDEIDSTFGRLKQINFPLDKSESVDPLSQNLMGIIMNYVIMIPAVSDKVRLPENKQSLYFNDVDEDKAWLTQVIAEKFLEDLFSKEEDHFGIWASIRESLGLNFAQKESYINDISLFLCEKDAAKRGFPDFLTLNQSTSTKLWLTVWWQLHSWLEQSFKQTYQLNFGRSLKFPEFLVARPYVAAMTPDDSSTFSNEYETWNKTSMMYKMGGLGKKELQNYIQKIYDRISERCFEERVDIINDIEYKGMTLIFGAEWHHKSNLSSLLDSLYTNIAGSSMPKSSICSIQSLSLLFIDRYIVSTAFPTATFYKRQITTCPLFISSHFNTVSGYSGTMTDDKYMFPQVLREPENYQLDPEIEKVRIRIQNGKNNEQKNHENADNSDSLLNTLDYKKVSLRIQNSKSSAEIAKYFNTIPFDNKGFVYLDPRDDLKYLQKLVDDSFSSLDIRKADFCRIHAIIDIGGVFKQFKTLILVKTIVDSLRKHCPQIKGGFFIDKDSSKEEKFYFIDAFGNAHIVESMNEEYLRQLSGSDENGWITFYHQAHGSTISVKQPVDSIALVTVGADTSERDICQGVMLLKNFLYDNLDISGKIQSAIFLIPEYVRSKWKASAYDDSYSKNVNLSSLVHFARTNLESPIQTTLRDDAECTKILERIQNFTDGSENSKNYNTIPFENKAFVYADERASQMALQELVFNVFEALNIQKAEFCRIHAFIDVGGVFEHFKNSFVAKAIMDRLADYCPNVSGSYFFQIDTSTNDEKLHFIDAAGKVILGEDMNEKDLDLLSGNDKVGWVIFYNKGRHESSMMVKHPPDSIAIVTAGINTSEMDLCQGLLVMPNFLYDHLKESEKIQKAIFMISQSVRDKWIASAFDDPYSSNVNLSSLISFAKKNNKATSGQQTVKLEAPLLDSNKNDNQSFFLKELDISPTDDPYKHVCMLLRSTISLSKTPICKIHTIIDIGANFKMFSNAQVAQGFLKFVQDECPNIKGSFFFQRDAAQMDRLHFLNLDGDITPLEMTDYEALKVASKTDENGWLTYYDQFHTTGSDVRQAQDAVAWTTIGPQTQERDLLQGVMRMRKFLYESTDKLGNLQSVIIVAPESMRKEFVKLLPQHSFSGINIDLSSLIEFTQIVSKRDNARENVSLAMIKLRKIARDEIMSLLLNDESIDFTKVESFFVKEQPERLELLKRKPKPINVIEVLKDLSRSLINILSLVIKDKAKITRIEKMMADEIERASNLQNIDSTVVVMSTHQEGLLETNIGLEDEDEFRKTKYQIVSSNEQQQQEQQQQQQQQQHADQNISRSLNDQVPWTFSPFQDLLLLGEVSAKVMIRSSFQIISLHKVIGEVNRSLAEMIHAKVYLTFNVYYTCNYGLENSREIADLRLRDQRRAMYMLYVKGEDEMMILLTNFDVKQISQITETGAELLPDLCKQFSNSQVYLLNALGNAICSCDAATNPATIDQLASASVDKELFVQTFFAMGFTKQIMNTVVLYEQYSGWAGDKKVAFVRYYLDYRVPSHAREAAEKTRFVKKGLKGES